jgi:very-short-patch-repair endonuclease
VVPPLSPERSKWLSDSEFDSPFEEEVCRALEAHGLIVHRQIGCAGYRIDLAVVDDIHPGRYALGIECDGATYHSSKTARDRDRLRQQVLEDMGWRQRILRVWSSDWVHNRDAQIDRILKALEAARFVEEQVEVIEADEASESLLLDDLLSDTAHETRSVQEVHTVPIVSELAHSLPEGVIPYQAYETRRLGAPFGFDIAAERRPNQIIDLLISIVRHEGPIHIDEATRRVIACWGIEQSRSEATTGGSESCRSRK